MVRVEGEIDQLDHSATGYRQLNDEMFRFDSPDPHTTCPEICLRPLSIKFINRCLEVINRGGLIVERYQSDDFTAIEINQDLPGIDGVVICDLIRQHLSTVLCLASRQRRIRQDDVFVGIVRRRSLRVYGVQPGRRQVGGRLVRPGRIRAGCQAYR